MLCKETGSHISEKARLHLAFFRVLGSGSRKRRAGHLRRPIVHVYAINLAQLGPGWFSMAHRSVSRLPSVNRILFCCSSLSSIVLPPPTGRSSINSPLGGKPSKTSKTAAPLRKLQPFSVQSTIKWLNLRPIIHKLIDPAQGGSEPTY